MRACCFLLVRVVLPPVLFLLIWGLLAIVMGGVFARKRGAAAMRELVASRLERSPGQQAKARTAPEGLVRSIGGFVAVCGLVTVPVSLVMMARG